MHAPGAPPHPSATAGEWQSGAVVGGRYRLVAPLGRGAMGEVWRAEHVYLHSPLALKLIATRDRGSGPEALARFSREAQAAAVLRSPHVVHIFDHGVDGDAAFIAMELLEGESLFDRLRRAGRLDPTDTARILAQLARAVDRAHAAGIVHRDLKPQNIFIAHVDGREVVKVLDFGIAKMTVLKGMDALATQEGFMVGTPCYMSPEQILGNRLVDGQSDLWQLGVVAFECTCGRLPFQSEAVGELMVQICSAPLPVPSRLARVPDGFDAWAARALAREPAERFASGHELAASLCRVLSPHTTSDRLADEPVPWAPHRYAAAEGAGAPPLGPPTTGRDRAWASAVGARPAARRRALALGLGGVVLLAGLAGGLAVWLGTGSGAVDERATAATRSAAPPASTSGAPAVPPAASQAPPPPAPPSASASAVASAAASGAPSAAKSASAAATASSSAPRPVQYRPPRPEEVLGI